MSSSVGSEVEPQPEAGDGMVPFDFRQRADLARDHIRRVEIAHEAFVRRMDRKFSALLRVKAHFDPARAEQVSFNEYLRALPNPSIVAFIEFGSLPGNLIFEIEPETAFNLVSVMLGGRKGGVEVRRPTEIEASLLGLIADQTCDPLKDTFDPLLSVEPTVRGFEFNPLLIPASDPPESALLLAYNLTIDGTELGRMSLCYPLSTLQPVGEILHQEPPEEEPIPDTPGPLVDVLPAVEVPVAVRLNPVTLPASDLVALEPGDVIRLSHGIDEPVVAVVDDHPMVEGRIGRSGTNVAFEFTNWRNE